MRFIVWCMGLSLMMVGDVLAVSPKIWRENSQAVFEKGKPEAVSFTRDGTVTLAPVLKQVTDTGEGFVWALARDNKGTLFIGTGNKGRVFALKRGADQPELIYDAPEGVAVFSLTVGKDGALYAGVSPNGDLVRIVPGKEPTVFCQTGDMHIWALLSRSDGGFWAATGGEQGRILKVSPKGAVEPIYVCDDPNVVSLAEGPDGHLYAGTDTNGLIYRVNRAGDVSVLYDAGEKEIHAIEVGKNGMVYAAAMAGNSPSKAQVENGKGGSNGKMSVLYAIRPSGSALRLWEVDDPLLLDVALRDDGSLRVVTGQKGRIYRVWPNGTASLLTQLEDVQPWSILPVGNGDLWIGTSGAGEIHLLSAGFAEKGLLTSAPHDFSLVSHWGRVSWRADVPSQTSVSVQTRSGNSETPDETWSHWSASVRTSMAEIKSPPARFLQYRIQLTSQSKKQTPQVRDIQLSGLQENVPPMVLSVKTSQGSDGDSNTHGREERGLWKVEWTGGDANDDAVVYSVSYRGENEVPWRLLKEDLSATSYIWATDAVPDGVVQVRVVASDHKSNRASESLTGEAVSAPFVIDNTRPTVQVKATPKSNRTVAISGVVEDALSDVRSVDYALNSGDWISVFPLDGILDTPRETLNFEIGDLKPGAQTLVVRARDAQGNVGVGKTVFEIK